ncbi:MAG: formylglycine-generating enzyme family protein [Kiritimatiellaeota bacterium]|nr:formylglycine-generating enzyme family protein [Kiritimatiellota bacterium]
MGSAASNTAGSKLRFPALERIERQERVEEQQRFEQKRRLQLHDVERLVQLALHKDDPDERILTLLRADRMLRKMQSEKPDPRVVQYLKNVNQMVLAVPPPKVFRNSLGLEFVLLQKAGGPFYVGRRPVSRTQVERFVAETGRANGIAGEAPSLPGGVLPVKGANGEEQARPAFVSWEFARAFCAWLSARERFPYRLPALEELGAVSWVPDCALWTRTVWGGPDPASARMRRRFDVSMYVASDPGKLLTAGERFPELPFARYRGLGFTVVTDVQAAVAARLKRLRGQL